MAQLVEALAQPEGGDPGRVAELLDSAPLSRFHRRAVIVSGMGFFTDAYDLFVIGTVAALVKAQWNLSTTETSWVPAPRSWAPSSARSSSVGSRTFGRKSGLRARWPPS